MWLLLTGLAKTNVLVLIASPLLAATFMFGDTAKMLFQGLIFVFIVHPFDVGDLCVIDDKLLEVRRIGIWCTTFSKVRTIGKQQQIIYPNSVLALKNVVNHKTDFDWNDHIEFLSSPDKKITEPLKRKIETYLNDEKEKFTPNFHSVEILEIADKAKIVVHIKHKLPTTEGWTYFECLKEKEKRRFEFAIYVQNLVKQLESKTETPGASVEFEHGPTTGYPKNMERKKEIDSKDKKSESHPPQNTETESFSFDVENPISGSEQLTEKYGKNYVQRVIPAGDNRRHVLIDTTSGITSCLLFLWAEVVVMNRVPTFNQSNIFGIDTRKWIKNILNQSKASSTASSTASPRASPRAPSTYDIQKAAELFLSSYYALSKGSIVDDLKHFQGDDEPETDNTKCIETLTKIVKVKGAAYSEDWELLVKLIPDCKTTEEITFEKVKLFMERARYSCMSLANTLISERDVVNCLNQVIRWIIIAAIFITWLLVTGFATTKVLVVIASPFLAVTFIFGDTAKSLFQGLIFVYVVHPFDVGDLCIIDEQLLEVRRISVWCTFFSSVRSIGEQQQVIYPNSVLALKNVTNYKTNFNLNDQIEFVSSPDKNITESVKLKIETYLDYEKEKFVPNFHSVEILEIGDKAKIVVHIKHKLPVTDGWTYFDCLKEKEKRRFKLAIYVQNLVIKEESEAKTPGLHSN
ncbi:hypothetical protein KSS87_007775 [Heliosperma pusillum]|nr:hypothetical protein KSS87_007775 [Heliosperma pusillum]